MRERKHGFLASIFRRRKSVDFEPTLTFAVGAVVGRNLARAGIATPVRAVAVSPDSMLSDASLDLPGYLSVFFRDSETPTMILVFPAVALRALGCAESGAPNAPVPPGVERASANAADFLALESTDQGADTPRPAPLHMYIRRFSGSPRDELAWRLSGSEVIRVGLGEGGDGGPALFACVAESTAARFSQSLAEGGDVLQAVRSFVLSPEPPAPDPALLSRTLRIAAPRAFLLGGLFLPARVECGTRVLEPVVSLVSAAPDKARALSAQGTWVAAGCEMDGKSLRIRYFFPAADREEAAKNRDACRGIATCLFRSSLPVLGAGLGGRLVKPVLGIDAKPDFTDGTGHLLIQARIRLGAALIPVDLFVDHAVISLLVRKHCGAGEIAAAAKMPVSLLPLALSVNEGLIRAGLDALLRSLVDPSLGPDFLPFGAFADLLTDRDLAVVLQNHLVRNLGRRSFRCLFSWAERAGDGETLRPVTPRYFDEERLIRLLPPQAREGWERGASALACAREDYIAMNREALAGIEEASRKKALLLSPRARLILDRTVAPGLRASAREAVRSAMAAGIPFASIRDMRAPQAQQFFATQSTRTVCLALLGNEKELPFVQAHVSQARRRLIAEELSLARAQLERGALGAGEVARAMTGMDAAARKMIEDAERQESARRSHTGKGT